MQDLNAPSAGAADRYEEAADAMVAGDRDTLAALLAAHPALVHQRSSRPHRATLLHYVAANGVEDFRQRSPDNAVEMARMLLEHGAEPDAGALMYDDENATTMEMLVSSTHPAAAGVTVPLVDTLVDFGAAANGPADDGRPLLMALAFQHPDAAEALVRRGARIDNIVTAAGLGRDDQVAELLTNDGGLRPDVRLVELADRLQPRPDSNIAWALVVAAALGRASTVDTMLRRGVDTGARAMVGFTAGHWAAINGHLDVVEVLLQHHAPLDDAANDHHATVLGAAIWAAVNAGRDDHVRIVEELLDGGAVADAVRLPTGSERIDALVQQHRATG